MVNREKNIEFIRIFAIFMTVMIHVSNYYINNFEQISNFDFLSSIFYNFISRICVPLFFMVSGIFLTKQEYNPQKYWNRILKFSIILVVWSFIYYFFNKGFTFKNFLKDFTNSIFNANATSRHLWFLYAIIGIYIALPFINNLCKNLNQQLENLFLALWVLLSGLDVIIIPLARSITNSNISISYPIPIINATYYLGYFIAGHILYERFKNIKGNKIKNILCFAGFIIPTAISIIITYLISIKINAFYQPFTWYRSILIVIAAISTFILIVINKNKFKSEIIIKLSKFSFGIYLIHMLVFKYIKDTVLMSISPIISIPLVTAVVYIISLILSFLLSKIPLLKKIV